MCNNNSDSIASLNVGSLVDTSSPSTETGEEYDEDCTYDDQENGSSVDIDTEADEEDCNLFEAHFHPRTTIENSWLATAEEGTANQDLWHYNERAYEELCYVTFSSEVNTPLPKMATICRYLSCG